MPVARRAPLGQHFLHSPSILNRIAEAARAAAASSDLIIEIGAGPGTLTGRLLDLGKHLVAIEIDSRLAARLRAGLGEHARLEVLETDILQTDLEEIISARTAGRAVVTGNLPYYITSPILRLIFDSAARVSEAILLVQKEVAARIAARPGTRDYGYLSVLCQAHSRPEILFTAPPGAFRPPPKVTSALVRLPIEPRLGVADRQAFLEFVQLCFHHKRKMLLNNLEKRFGKERVARLPEARLRAEQLSPEQLAALFLRLEKSMPQRHRDTE